MHFEIGKNPLGADEVATIVDQLVDQQRRDGAGPWGNGREDDPAMQALKTVFDAGGPSMVYQPIVHIDSDRVIGAEALSRFPAGYATREWFEIAGDAGLAADLEMLAAHKAMAQLDEPTRESLGWEFIGINISPQTLVDPRFIELVNGNVGRHVVLELTDQREQPDWPVLRAHLDRARDLGVRIAVNALTCDPASQFKRLIDIAPDIIKLDTGYTTRLIAEHDHRTVAEEFLVSCTQRGVFVVAVGVEEPHDLDVLREVGIEAAQGYVFGKPQPLGQFSPAPRIGVGDGPIARLGRV